MGEVGTEGVEATRPAPMALRSTIVENSQVARDTYRLRVMAPELADRIRPGQFVMVRIAGRTDPLLARPYALYDLGGDGSVEFLYLVLGNGTRQLSQTQIGESVDLLGPLGNTFPEPTEADRVLMVAGGIGQTPFLALTHWLTGAKGFAGVTRPAKVRRLSMVWGVRSREYLADVSRLERAGATVAVASNDGSAGRKGFVTDLVTEALATADSPTLLFGCGPEPMLERLTHIANQAGVPLWVSLETKMACGYGVCFSCVCPIVEDNGWDYRRVCIEGPIFPANKIAWP